MPIRIKPRIRQKFYLDKSDKIANDGKEVSEKERTFIDVRQAAQGENEERNELFAEFQRQYMSNGDVYVRSRLSFDDIRRKECFLTICASNIQAEDGNPLWLFSNGRFRSEEEFKAGWAILEPYIVEEIHENVLKANPHWSQAGVEIDEDGNEKDTPSGEASSQT